jgi:kinesin family protein 22
MQGSDEQPGLIPRVARKVVSLAAQHTAAAAAKGVTGGKCSVTVSYLEIYNEKVYDLLRPKTKDLPIREDTNKNILIPDLAHLPVRTYEDFANTYAEGCKNRTVAPTSLNAHSSRSHAVLILTVTNSP